MLNEGAVYLALESQVFRFFFRQFPSMIKRLENVAANCGVKNVAASGIRHPTGLIFLRYGVEKRRRRAPGNEEAPAGPERRPNDDLK